ncbi:hypothetical protein PTE30175_02652 [Pandoraea terrae]|uniref:Uncharacterized protein n=1 Tax=Pandoraea terrae TaxID=1537710 RepID=A0A5E4VPL7_9BURK|nr:hypothetical protein [Pandoraea terrae]VVE12955.1 hypothetical protein PTE30175_02652 [Pandoraea terrae]
MRELIRISGETPSGKCHRTGFNVAPAHAARIIVAAWTMAAALTGCATAPRNTVITAPAATAPPGRDAGAAHLAAADAAAQQYRTCLYGYVARYAYLNTDSAALAGEAAQECAPIAQRFRQERQAGTAANTTAAEAARQADVAADDLRVGGIRQAQARATEIRVQR